MAVSAEMIKQSNYKIRNVLHCMAQIAIIADGRFRKGFQASFSVINDARDEEIHCLDIMFHSDKYFGNILHGE